MRFEPTRAQIVGFAFLAALTVAVMVLLAVEGPVTVGPRAPATAR
jgi:hypothetical protein